MNNGLIVINKPSGCTSRDIVNMLCKILHTKSDGHIGTLDPLAEGVLVCLTGKYTKLTNILINHDKEYIAEFKLGMLTDTLDITGKILKEEKYSLNINKLKKILNDYIKTYEQEVPIYSAIKVWKEIEEDVNKEYPQWKSLVHERLLSTATYTYYEMKCSQYRNKEESSYLRKIVRQNIGVLLKKNRMTWKMKSFALIVALGI